MRQTEQYLVSYLDRIRASKPGFLELHTETKDGCIDISLDARFDLFASECIFDDCGDEEAKRILEAFLTQNLNLGWDLSLQLCKLLATHGRLVRETMEPLLETLNWSCVYQEQLFLSYLAVRDDGEDWAARMLDVMREDFRDGLLLACYRLHSESLDRKLMAKFLEWGTDAASLSGTGELYALEQFIAKWLNLYPYSDLEGTIRLYFKYRAQG
jgi:hypothetical protein